ncbi:MAG: hypothetical protein WC069_03805 [Candidatus Shapirobacteria bacterium]
MNKYFWASLILISVSMVGVWWIMSKNGTIKTSEIKREEAINAIYPTTVSTKISPTGKKLATPTSMVVGQATNKGGMTDSNQTIFTSMYSPDRTLYIEKEYSGTRYVLYKSDSKITVHVGNMWSWVHPKRELEESGVVSGQKTFTYEIRSQKIVDFVDGNKKYTIQCVHNGISEAKAECEKFLDNFKLL